MTENEALEVIQIIDAALAAETKKEAMYLNEIAQNALKSILIPRATYDRSSEEWAVIAHFHVSTKPSETPADSYYVKKSGSANGAAALVFKYRPAAGGRPVNLCRGALTKAVVTPFLCY